MALGQELLRELAVSRVKSVQYKPPEWVFRRQLRQYRDHADRGPGELA